MNKQDLRSIMTNMDAKDTLPVKVRVNFGNDKKSYTITEVQSFHQWSDELQLITTVDTHDTMEKLMEFRQWLIDKTEEYQARAKAPDASSEGAHFDRGHADGFIQARAQLEKLFDYWDCR